MSSRESRRITKLREQRDELVRELFVLIDSPGSLEAASISMKHRALRSMSHYIQSRLWLGSYEGGK